MYSLNGFTILFLLAASLVVFPFAAQLRWDRQIRDPYWRAKRRRKLAELVDKQIRKTNSQKSNEAIARQLKIAGLRWTVFQYRLLQAAAPVMASLAFIALFELKKQLAGSRPFPFLFFLVGILLGLVAPMGFVWVKAHIRKEKLTSEIIHFSHRLVVCINERVQLYVAVRRAGRTAKLLKPYLDQMLVDWLKDPREAIQRFANEIVIHEVLPITNTLLASWNAPDDKIVDLFQQQIRNMDTMRDFMIKKRIEVSPLRQIFVVMLPFLVIVGLVLLPWYYSMMDMMKKTF